MKVPFNDLARDVDGLQAQLAAKAATVLARGWYVMGSELAAFEQEFASYCGVAHCVGVASGSDALELALRALGIGPGDRVATAANAGAYGTLAILATGAQPQFVEIDEARLTADPAAIERVLVSVKAVILTHLYGRLVELDALRARARALGVALVEDAAQAHGAVAAGKRAGALGTLGCFSFYPTKNLGAAGDGGAVVTDDAALAERLRALRQYGWKTKYCITVPGGRNSRLDEMQAALLRLKLPQLDAANARRRSIARAYSENLRHPLLRVPTAAGADDVAHLYVVRTKAREALRSWLAEGGVATEVHYPIADFQQPVFDDRHATLQLPITAAACQEVLSLPCFPGLTESEQAYVIDRCNAWPGEGRSG